MDDASGDIENEANDKGPAKDENGNSRSSKKVSRKNSDLSCKSKRSVKRKLKTFSFGKWQKGLNKEKAKKRTFNLDRETCRSSSSIVSESSIENVTCICTGYRKTKVIVPKNPATEETSATPSTEAPGNAAEFCVVEPVVIQNDIDPRTDDYQDIQGETSTSGTNLQRAPPLPQSISNINEINLTELTLALRNHLCLSEIPESLMLRYTDLGLPYRPLSMCRLNLYGPAHTQVDYIHHLVPGLLEITNCSFYWGRMNRYEAEKQLDKKPEGTFLLRDSAQDEYLFSVSFRRYGRTLHARIEQLNHNFSFDAHDPNVFASPTVCGLLEHYKNPRCCMFFEPMLMLPVHRTFPFDLQHLCRSVIADRVTYDNISVLQLPKKIKSYLKEYHYKQKVRVRHLENDV